MHVRPWSLCATLCVLLAQVATVTYLFISLRRRENHYVRQVNTRVSDNFVRVLNDQFSNLNFLNNRNAALFNLVGAELSFDDYLKALQTPLDSSFPEVEAYEFIPRIAQANVAAFNRFCASNISSSCYLKELNTTITPVLNTTSVFQPVALNRTFYYPILYLYPISTKYAFINNLMGFDHLSRKEGVDLVSQFSTGANSTVTRQTRVVVPSANPYGSYGVLVAQSVYSGQDPTLLTGYSVLVLRLATIIDRAFITSAFSRQNVEVSMFDATQDGITEVVANNVTLLYKENKASYRNVWQPSEIHRYSTTKRIDFLNRSYLFFFTFTHKYEKSLRSHLPLAIPLVILGGFILLNSIILLLRHVYKQRLSQIDGVRANQMLAYTNHELRNPLNIIRGIVDYTLRNLDEPRDVYRSDLTVVVRTCDFLEHIVSDILVLQLLEEDRLTLDTKPCQLKLVFADIMGSTVQKMEENKKVKLYMECDDDITVMADEFRLKQVILNLLTNSIKYTKEGLITVKAASEPESNSVLITVTDTGIGISEGKKHMIFKLHLQTDVKEIGRHGSYGMGLYLVRILAKRMGWTVGFATTFGQGSTFWVRIPTEAIH